MNRTNDQAARSPATDDQVICRDAFVALAVRQWEGMVLFYERLLNQSPNPHRPNVYAEFHLAGLRLGLFHPQASHRAEFSQPERSSISLCLEVNNLEQSRQAVDAAYAALTQQLPTWEGGQTPHYGMIAIASHGRECYAYDPEGNRLILHESAV